MKKYRMMAFTLALSSLLLLIGMPSASYAQDEVARPNGWQEVSHSNDVDPDYSIVFPQDNVNTMTITIDPQEWQAMQEDMTTLYGEFGTRSMMGGAGRGGFGGGEMAELPEGFQPPFEVPEGFPGFEPGQIPDGELPQPPEGFQGFERGQGPGGGGFGGGNLIMGSGQDPMWVAVDINLGDEVWTNVGFRFKGNSSLAGAWGSGSLKLGFRLNFDKFEDDYPEINNQRFYGFKKLSFSSNWNDDSFLREKVVADIFREAGVPAAQTAFYAIYIDYGEGPVYFGLYTAVEVIDDTVIQTQFEDDSGNLYKPEGRGATFAAGSFDEASFEKQTNASADDYSDILALFEALHAETRLTDPDTWRANLETVLDVDGFMRWLAVNTVIQNWDTYGAMSHNYYLYNDPTSGLLTWIPWDHNLSLTGAGFGGRGNMGGGGTLDQNNVSEQWPLIRYLMDDPVYEAIYNHYVETSINGAFEPDRMAATYQRLSDMIRPYALAEIPGYSLLSSTQAFENSVSELISHTAQRYAEALSYLSNQ